MIAIIIFLLTGIIGLTVVTIILKNYNKNKIMNINIIIFLSILSICQLYLGIRYCDTENYFKYINYIHSSYTMFAVPLLYIYFKNLSDTKNIVTTSEVLLHSIFPILFLIITYKGTHFENEFPSINLDLTLSLMAALYSMLYNYLCYQILSKKIWSRNLTKTIKHQNELIKNWTKFLYVLISVIAIQPLFNITTEINLQLVTSFVLLIINFKILISPEILYGYENLNAEIHIDKKFNVKQIKIWGKPNKTIAYNYQHKILENKINLNRLKYIEKIEQISFKEEVFLKPNLKITCVANKLNIPNSHLIYLFKYHSTVSFIDYKKIVRVHHACKLIEKNYLKSNTLNALSKKVGFSSYDPFFRSFKEITGQGPLEYCNKTMADSSKL